MSFIHDTMFADGKHIHTGAKPCVKENRAGCGGPQFVVVMCRKLRSRTDSTLSMRSYNEARWVEEEHPGS